MKYYSKRIYLKNVIKIIIIFIRESMDDTLEKMKENMVLRCGNHNKIFIHKSHKFY